MTHELTLDDRLDGVGRILGDRLLSPHHEAFPDLTATVFDGDDRRPLAIARPRTTAEVAATVRAARDAGVPLTVRSGGHSYRRDSVLDAGLVLDLRLLDQVSLDLAAGVGHAQGGVTTGAYTATAAEHGLVTGFGDTGSVGVAGIALGGGIGYLSRRDGLTVDNLLGAEVVLTDGTVVEAADDPELLWGLRGAGTGLGVVTRLDLRLYPTSTIVGGMLAWPAEPRVLTDVVTALTTAPDGLAGMANVMIAPPLPMIPAELHGTPIVFALVCWSGPVEAADDALAPLRAHPPLLDGVGEVPYTALFGGGPKMARMRADAVTGFTDVPDEDWAAAALDAVLSAGHAGPAAVNLRPMGGAIARVGADETAFAHRDQALMVTVSGLTGDAADAAGLTSWVSGTAARLGIDTGPAYVNFTGRTPDLARAYPPATVDRLRALAARLDPEGIFAVRPWS